MNCFYLFILTKDATLANIYFFKANKCFKNLAVNGSDLSKEVIKRIAHFVCYKYTEERNKETIHQSKRLRSCDTSRGSDVIESEESSIG